MAKKLDSSSFDKEFKKINTLKWLPWVGENYEHQNPQLLIVGESHYAWEDEEDTPEEVKSYLEKDDFTRAVLEQHLTKKSIKYIAT